MTLPQCCGLPMRDISERDDRVLGLTAYICDRCKAEQLLAADTDDPPLDDTPTDTEPGSPERQLVYADRAARGRAVLHPDDRKPTPGGLVICCSTRKHTHEPTHRGIRGRLGRYQARLNVGGRQITVGTYETLAEAVRARDRAETRAGRKAV